MKSNFHERKEARLEAFQRLAQSNEKLSVSAYEQAKEIGSYIPMGQPILVGHHSERRHRRDLERIDNNMRKSVEASQKAEYYSQRAETLLNGTAISSDDPTALEQLQEKAERLQALQDLMKACNKIIKSRKADVEKVEALVALGMKEATAIALLQPDWVGRVGFPSYKLTNNNANLKRVQDRIKHLDRVSKIESQEEEINGVTIKISQEDNRVQIFFPGIPAEAVRKELKSSGFRWAPSVGAWMGYINSRNIRRAKEIVSSL